MLHTKLLPDLMHVNFLPDEIEVKPTLEQDEPGFGVEACELGRVTAVKDKKVDSASPRTSGLLMRLMEVI